MIIDKDHGYAKLMATFADKKNLSGTADVGVPDTPHQPSGIPMDELGAIHEFGSGFVPQRSFLRAWFDAKLNELRDQLRLRAANVIVHQTDTMPGALAKFSAFALHSLDGKIKSNTPPDLKYETVKRKRHALALVATGQLIDSMTAEVKSGGTTQTIRTGAFGHFAEPASAPPAELAGANMFGGGDVGGTGNPTAAEGGGDNSSTGAPTVR